jgi:hypothetical protein
MKKTQKEDNKKLKNQVKKDLLRQRMDTRLYKLTDKDGEDR